MMREKLAAPRVALQEMNRASVFRKAIAEETALVKAVELIEDMMREIEEMKKREAGGK